MQRKGSIASILLTTFILSGCGAGATKSDWTYNVDMFSKDFGLQNLAIGENTAGFRFFRHSSQGYAADNFQSNGIVLDTLLVDDYDLRPTVFNKVSGTGYGHKTTITGTEIAKYNNSSELVWSLSGTDIPEMMGEFESSQLFLNNVNDKLIVAMDSNLLMFSESGELLTSSNTLTVETDCSTIISVKFHIDDSTSISCKSNETLVNYHFDKNLNTIDSFSTPISYAVSNTYFALSSDAIYISFDGSITKYNFQGESQWSMSTTGLLTKLYLQNDSLLVLSNEKETNKPTLQKFDKNGEVEWVYQVDTLLSKETSLLMSGNKLLLSYKDVTSGLKIDTTSEDIGTVTASIKNHLLSDNGELIKIVNMDNQSTIYITLFSYYGSYTTNAGISKTRDFITTDSTLVLLNDYLTVDLVDGTFDNIKDRAQLSAYSLSE